MWHPQDGGRRSYACAETATSEKLAEQRGRVEGGGGGVLLAQKGKCESKAGFAVMEGMEESVGMMEAPVARGIMELRC